MRYIFAHLPVPSFSTASTSDSTSETEKGLLILRCASSERLVFWFKGTTASASTLIGGTEIKALESGVVPLVTSSVEESAKSWLVSTWSGTLVVGGGSHEALENFVSKMGLSGNLNEKQPHINN